MADKRKILLIQPPFRRLFKETYSLTHYPLSLGYLAAVTMEKTDWLAVVYNADFGEGKEAPQIRHLTGEGFENYKRLVVDSTAPIWKKIKEKIMQETPSAVGITCSSQNFASARVVASLVKEINPDIPVIIGGPHPTLVPRQSLQCRDIDVCARREGERTIVEYLEALDGRRTLESVNGIFFRRGGEIVETPPREFIEDPDSIPYPSAYASRVLIDFEKYPKSAFGRIFAIRGCPFNCFYCGSRELWSRRIRRRSVDNVIGEIRSVLDLGADYLGFEDDTFGVSEQYLEELSEAVHRHFPGLKWNCKMHIKLVTEKNISLLKKSGCDLILLGVESGNNDILKKIRKGYTIDQAFAAADLIKKHKIKLYTYFMVGFPWDTEETLMDTFCAMKRIKTDFLVYSIFTPYPNTEAFHHCKEKGLVDDDFDISLYNHQSPENCFIEEMPKEKFRKIVEKIEYMVDRKNTSYVFMKNISFDVIKKIRRFGLVGSLRKFASILRCYFVSTRGKK